MLSGEGKRIYAPMDIFWHCLAALLVAGLAVKLSAWVAFLGMVGFAVREASQTVKPLTWRVWTWDWRFWEWSIQKQVETYAPLAILLVGMFLA